MQALILNIPISTPNMNRGIILSSQSFMYLITRTISILSFIFLKNCHKNKKPNRPGSGNTKSKYIPLYATYFKKTICLIKAADTKAFTQPRYSTIIVSTCPVHGNISPDYVLNGI